MPVVSLRISDDDFALVQSYKKTRAHRGQGVSKAARELLKLGLNSVLFGSVDPKTTKRIEGILQLMSEQLLVMRLTSSQEAITKAQKDAPILFRSIIDRLDRESMR